MPFTISCTSPVGQVLAWSGELDHGSPRTRLGHLLDAETLRQKGHGLRANDLRSMGFPRDRALGRCGPARSPPAEWLPPERSAKVTGVHKATCHPKAPTEKALRQHPLEIVLLRVDLGITCLNNSQCPFTFFSVHVATPPPMALPQSLRPHLDDVPSLGSVHDVVWRTPRSQMSLLPIPGIANQEPSCQNSHMYRCHMYSHCHIHSHINEAS